MITSHWRHRSGGIFLILLLASITRAQWGEPATAKVETKTGAITGRVVTENGEPHAYVNVVVRPDTPQGLPATQTTTNREGVFKLSGLERGLYNVSAYVPAYMPKSLFTKPVVYKAGELVTLVLVKGGVITGTITNAKGDPVGAIGVRVRMVRDEMDHNYGDGGKSYENMTDDRGVYRVYGLPQGTYVVSADASVEERQSWPIFINRFAKELPTYAPSSNRAGAQEISVRIGEEISDVNIRYRGERGSTISGFLTGLSENSRGFNVTLTSITEGGPRWYNHLRGAPGEFAFDGIPDGDYHLAGTANWADGTHRQSESVLLKVRGADIEGLELTAAPLASIDGRVVLAPLTTAPPECNDQRQPQFSEISVTAWHRVTEAGKKKPHFVWRAGGPATPNAQGNVTMSEVAAGEYYFAARFSAPQWFLRSIALAPPNIKPTDVTRTWTTVKPGDRLSDLTFTLAQGAALVSGEIPLADGQKLPEKLVAFLVPAEPERAEEVLRYFAVPVNAEGRFWVNNVAPGRYRMLAQPASEDTRQEMSKLRLPDGAEIRSSLRGAETKTEIELKPCQNLAVRLPPP